MIDLPAPIFDMTGRVATALTTPFMRRFTGESLPFAEARNPLVATAKVLSHFLGAGLASMD